MFKLYYAPGTCALASHIALEEAGASYTAERLDFKNSQQTSPQYLAINPKGRVPALVTERGTLTETPAILAYIAQGFPQARLMPDDAFAFAQAQSFNNAEHDVAQPDRARVHLGAGRIEHELLVDPRIERRRDRRQRQLLRQRAIRRRGTKATRSVRAVTCSASI